MSRYIALFIGAGDPEEKAGVPDEVSADFMRAWGEWHAAHQAAIVESGSPLGPNLRVTEGRTDAKANQMVAWMMVEADSADEAASIFASHPHVSLTEGNAIDVMQLLPIPGT